MFVKCAVCCDLWRKFGFWSRFEVWLHGCMDNWIDNCLSRLYALDSVSKFACPNVSWVFKTMVAPWSLILLVLALRMAPGLNLFWPSYSSVKDHIMLIDRLLSYFTDCLLPLQHFIMVLVSWYVQGQHRRQTKTVFSWYLISCERGLIKLRRAFLELFFAQYSALGQSLPQTSFAGSQIPWKDRFYLPLMLTLDVPRYQDHDEMLQRKRWSVKKDNGRLISIMWSWADE